MNVINSILAALLLTAMPLCWAQTSAPKDSLPPPPAGKDWKLVWQDEFEGTKLDETKWNQLGDWKRRDGFWVKDGAYLSGKGTLLLRTRKDGDRYTCGASTPRASTSTVTATTWRAARCPSNLDIGLLFGSWGPG